MMSQLQPVILWVALPLAFLLIVAAINVLATVIKITDQKFDPDK